jgi:ribosomal protein S18 acetylase RimI-like enzyme
MMTTRPVAENDWPRIGELGELLVRTHHAFNPSRFIHPDRLPGDLYTSRVQAEVARGHAVVHVAEMDGRIVGYVFAGLEPESWKELRHEAGYIHDIVVDQDYRNRRIGDALVAAAVDWFEARGVVRIMLWTAPQNVDAQRLFHRIGFRATMIEMTRSTAP